MGWLESSEPKYGVWPYRFSHTTLKTSVLLQLYCTPEPADVKITLLCMNYSVLNSLWMIDVPRRPSLSEEWSTNI